MLKSFYHTGFVVKNLEDSVQFYTEVMGLNLKREAFEATGETTEQVTGLKGVTMKVAFVDLKNGHHLELIEYVYPPGTEAHTNINDLRGGPHSLLRRTGGRALRVSQRQRREVRQLSGVPLQRRG